MSFARIILALALIAAGCGAAQGEKLPQCAENCATDYMSCIEQGGCVDSRDGQIVPCEEECATKRAACEESCG